MLCTQSVGKITNTLANTQTSTPTSYRFSLPHPHAKSSKHRPTTESDLARDEQASPKARRRLQPKTRNFPPTGKHSFLGWNASFPAGGTITFLPKESWQVTQRSNSTPSARDRKTFGSFVRSGRRSRTTLGGEKGLSPDGYSASSERGATGEAGCAEASCWASR